ncbi:MAG: hypothetical protein WBA68_10135 [Alteraurantiacibacter sp.]
MSARLCHHCKSPDVVPDCLPGSALCADCMPISLHIVSNQTAPGGGSLAVCRCGWHTTVTGNGHMIAREKRVRAHWNEVLAKSGVAERLPEVTS